MKPYLYAMILASSPMLACSDLDEDDQICYYLFEDELTEEESDSGDHPDNQSNEMIAWM